MKCAHCGVGADPDCLDSRGRELTTNEALKMFADLKKIDVSKLVISGGEFTTRRDWKMLLESALAKFIMVRLITNGWLGQRLLEELESIPGAEKLVLSVSLDGLGPTHDDNRKNGSFKKVAEILDMSSPIYRTVITTVMRKNFGELDDVFLWLKGRCVPVWAIQLGLPEGHMPREEFVGRDNVGRLADKIVAWQKSASKKTEIIPDDCFGYAHEMRAAAPWQGCQAGRNLITILANGDVTGCPTTFHWPCGNVRDMKIVDIWNGKSMDDFRNDLPFCKICNNSVCHGGCRAVDKCFGEQFCF